MHIPRRVPSGGQVLAGRYFPAGSIVGISPRLVHRTKGAYGEDAMLWNPDRWLDEDNKDLNRNSLVFGAGARSKLLHILSLIHI